MKLKRITIENFRGFSDKTTIDIERDITAFVGGNDAGKSSIMEVLEVFFNGGLEQGDASVFSTTKKVSISCVFSDFPSKVVLDATRETTLADEYLLNEDNLLEIKKVFDCSSTKPKQIGTYAVARHPSGEQFEDLLSLKLNDLKKRAKELNVDLSTVNQTVSSELRSAIWKSQAQELVLKDIQLDKEDAKKLYDAVSAYFPLFALFKSDRASTDQDAEAQDPMKLAIREVTESVAEEFSAIESQIQDALRDVASATIRKITEISPAIGAVLKPNVSSKKLDSLFSVSLTGENEIPINKRGSGVRRLVLFGFFRAAAERKLAGDTKRGVIYAVEEPETSQHPNSQLLILSALRDIAKGGTEQVLLTTHTPVLASRLDERSIRFVTRNAQGLPCVRNIRSEDERREIAESLGVLPDNRVKLFLEVEGPHDIDFVKNISRNLAQLHPNDYADFSQAESEGRLIFIPMGGGILQCWANNLNGINKPIFHIVDRDYPPPADPHYQQECESFIQAGHTVFVTTKRELESYIPLSIIKAEQPCYIGTGDDFDDVPKLFSEATKAAYQAAKENGVTPLPRSMGESSAKGFLNATMAARIATDALFDEGDPNGEVRSWIRQITQVLRAGEGGDHETQQA